jgi:hypothetical protein
MRLQIVTLLFFVISSNALRAPRRGDIVRGDSIPTSWQSLKIHHQHTGHYAEFGDETSLDPRGIDVGAVFNGIKTACAAWAHAKQAGIVRRRGVFGEEVRLEARGPNINIDLGAVMNGLQNACLAWSRAKDAGLIQRRGLDARRLELTSEERKAMKGKVKKITNSIEASQDKDLPEWLKSWPVDW